MVHGQYKSHSDSLASNSSVLASHSPIHMSGLHKQSVSVSGISWVKDGQWITCWTHDPLQDSDCPDGRHIPTDACFILGVLRSLCRM